MKKLKKYGRRKRKITKFLHLSCTKKKKSTSGHLALNLGPGGEVRRSTKHGQRGGVDGVALGVGGVAAAPYTARCPRHGSDPLPHDGQYARQAA